MAYEAYLKNDNVLAVAVAYEDTALPSTAASVFAVVYTRNSTGDVVEGSTSTFQLTQDDTDGTYERLIDEDLYSDRVWYTAEFVIETSDGVRGGCELDFWWRDRRFA